LTVFHQSHKLIEGDGEGMINRTTSVGLIFSSLLMVLGCSSTPTPAPNPDTVRQHADKAFQQLKAQEHPRELDSAQPSPQASTAEDSTSAPTPSVQKGVQVPLAEIGPSDGEYVRATGYGNLSKGLYLCQHSADLAARVELSKLVRVQVKETSVDRIREKTGKDAEQDIEVVREGLVNEVLTDVRIVDRKVDKEAGTCSSIAVIPRRNLFPVPPNPNTGVTAPSAH
jgi:hypothetical protein